MNEVEVYFDDFKVEHRKSPVIQSQDYYPFGLTFNSSNRENSISNQHQYNDKELQDELNLGWLDYGARMYMPELGRWTVIDPLSELNKRWSSYHYVHNNPLRFIDPDGMKEFDEIDPNEFEKNKQVQKDAKAFVNALQNADDPDWASKGPFKVHQTANYNGVRRESAKNREKGFQKRRTQALDAATVYADGATFQTSNYSYRHGMRDGSTNQTVDEAVELADKFVRQQFGLAKQLLENGEIYEAYFEFGVGLHALQDATSPAHGGFQSWTGNETKEELWGHVSQELFYPGRESNLQKITNQYLDWFENSSSGPLPSENLFMSIKTD
jgi:RHS repeat-associated protein